ncbi:sensor histidine kinase [Lederbergia citri]|uniref:histidine kinase n=1 Tax=Lederbergia citri TaxID=2833580 RepID=A0A942TFP0_9BACI|nr:sensor histidine kinase [Lederbergia citri]MBS4195916.1 histidine kinase [Lederbergia citri]
MRKLLHMLHSLSLRSRLIIAVIICILLPWMGTYVVSNYITKDLLEKRAVEESRNSLRMIELSVNNILDDIMYTSNYIQFNTEFNRLLKSYQALNLHSFENKNKLALHHTEVTKALAGITDLLSPTYITILFENNLFYTNYSTLEYDPREFYEEPWFDQLKDLNFYKSFWLGAHKNYIAKDSNLTPYLITIGRKIESSGELKAYVIISLDESRISHLFEAFQSEIPTHFFLTDENGVIFSSEDKSKIGEKLPFQVKQNQYNVIDFNNEQHLLVTYPLSYANWRLVSLVPYHDTIGAINNVSRTTILIQGVFLLIFLLGLIVLVREITKPVLKLNKVTKSVEEGDLRARANIFGNNDLAHLGQSFDHMLDTVETMIEQVRIQEEQKRNAELEMLQAQINPHFLFNTLNAIRLKIKLSGDQDSAALIYSLSALLRMTINRNNAFITLEDELMVVKHYVDLMNFRHKYNAELDIFIDEEVKKLKVPRFFLQPVIENSIIHGYKQKNGIIKIAAEQSQELLTLTVADDGVGIPQKRLLELRKRIYENQASTSNKYKASFTGIGVQNVYQRLKLIYGDAFHLNVKSEQHIGTSFTFEIPIRKENELV